MAEYIDREAAIDAITDFAGKAPTRSAYDAIWKSARALRKIPTADVVPVVCGQWTTKHYIDGIFEGTNFDECSACGYQRVFEDPALKTRYDYCPRCGAKLEQDREFPGN